MSSTDTVPTPRKEPLLGTFNQVKDLLRFITCGSVDDGKSTLIGRLLYETNAIYENELQMLKNDSTRHGTNNGEIDYALLLDGLSSEREQGITIDVAYRYFSTQKRKFIVADTPGHEQYTRNMATGASLVDCAVIMIDARKGILTQTKRHSFITSMMGINKAIVAINKIDLIEYDEHAFVKISQEYIKFAKQLIFDELVIIPVSALNGDNVTTRSIKTPWYHGNTLLGSLEDLAIKPDEQTRPFQMSVQWVNRPNLDFRGYAGTISQGCIKPGERVTIYPKKIDSTVSEIIVFENSLSQATQGQSITLTLEDEIDISRGDVISSNNKSLETGNSFQVKLLWMSQKSLVVGRQYFFKLATTTTTCIPTKLKYLIDINTLNKVSSNTISFNEVGVAEISTTKTITFEPFSENRKLGAFILIDRETNETAAAGFINFALRRSGNIHKQQLSISESARSVIKGHEPCVIWFTGISGAGKSTIANELEKLLNEKAIHTTLLDGDNVRFGLNKDLGFTENDRAENIRRIAEVSKLMTEAGLITLVSFISPFSSERKMARNLVGKSRFIEVFIDTDLEVAEERDIKGLYQKARAGEIKNFTGISSPYQIPDAPDIHIKTKIMSALEAAKVIFNNLKEKSLI